MKRLLAVAGVLAGVAGALPASGGAAPDAHAAGSCGIGSGTGYGYSYLTSLTVSGTSCATGRTLARHHGRARGWSCTKRVLDRSSVQYDARMTCHSGSRRVVWTYTQNT